MAERGDESRTPPFLSTAAPHEAFWMEEAMFLALVCGCRDVAVRVAESHLPWLLILFPGPPCCPAERTASRSRDICHRDSRFSEWNPDVLDKNVVRSKSERWLAAWVLATPAILIAGQGEMCSVVSHEILHSSVCGALKLNVIFQRAVICGSFSRSHTKTALRYKVPRYIVRGEERQIVFEIEQLLIGVKQPPTGRKVFA